MTEMSIPESYWYAMSVEALYSFRCSVTRMIYELYNRSIIELKLLETRSVYTIGICMEDHGRAVDRYCL